MIAERYQDSMPAITGTAIPVIPHCQCMLARMNAKKMVACNSFM